MKLDAIVLTYGTREIDGTEADTTQRLMNGQVPNTAWTLRPRWRNDVLKI